MEPPAGGADRGGAFVLLRDAAVRTHRGGRRNPAELEVKADVSLGPDNPGFKLTGIKLTVRGEVDGLDADGFAKPLRPRRSRAR